jgi:DNA polymerase
MGPQKFAGVDFETYSDCNLPKHGLDRYINDPSFQPLIVSVTANGNKQTFDFVFGGEHAKRAFEIYMTSLYKQGYLFAAHNVGFERAVMRWLGFGAEILRRFIDTAVIARCEGAASKLEAAAPQLTGIDKMDVGVSLIKRFSIPNEWNNFSAPTRELIEADEADLLRWQQFKDYCEVDAEASEEIAKRYPWSVSFSASIEARYERLTDEMNQNGWHVDLELVREMKLRYEQNSQDLLDEFAREVDPNLNLNSSAQLKKWCEERGIKSKSFDSDHVEKLLSTLTKAINKIPVDSPRYWQYLEVRNMLEVKKALGGSTLNKLQKILDLVGYDGRLRDQYLHCGAGQTYRTSARGVQMQNLKKLGSEPMDMEDVYDEEVELTNEELAKNMRQVFTASTPQGRLLVGDFSSVESRGLAYLAGEEWKLDAYRKGQDIYKVLASRFSGVPYEDITKEARAEGKYSELSCGYQAGGQAVKDFMHRLGFEVDLEGANERVAQWRAANPKIVELWATLDRTLWAAVSSGQRATAMLAHSLNVIIEPFAAPDSLRAQHPGIMSLRIFLNHQVHGTVMERVIHGVYVRGKQLCYYKPSELKSGALWRAFYHHPKTKQVTFYSIYGGKLAGIITQSLCRELFFYSLQDLHDRIGQWQSCMRLVGQFHDEIVVEWYPREDGGSWVSLQQAQKWMEASMTKVMPGFEDFPLAAEIKSDYRYTK